MLECGPSVLAGMKRAKIPSDSPDVVLVSHLHGDHFGGLPFLLLEYLFSNPRSRPLTVAGPPTTPDRVRALYRELYREAHCRETRFELNWVEMQPGTKRNLAGFDVTAFEVPHGADPVSLGYRVEGDGASLVFSGDSAWTDSFIEQTRGTDLFLCECCSMKPEAPIHVSYDDILANRSRIGSRRLLLTHLGSDVRAATDLDVERAHDGMVIDIGR